MKVEVSAGLHTDASASVLLLTAKPTMYILLFASVLVAAVSASDVLEFTNQDFNARIRNYPFILVEFYAPWSGLCNQLDPEYEKAATMLKRDDPPIPLAKVDCVAEKDLCERYTAGKFKVFRNGEFSFEYNGPREADGIVKYLRSKAGPSSRPIANEAELQALLAKDEFVACGFFESESSGAFASFKKVADQLSEEYRFCHSFAEELRTGAKEHYANRIVAFQARHLHSKFEPAESITDNVYDTKAIRDFVRQSARSLCDQRTTSNAANFNTPLITVYYDVDYVKNETGTKYWRDQVLKVATKLINDEQKQVQFAISNAEEFQQELNEFGVEIEGKIEKPRVTARNAVQKKYVMTTEFSPENLEAFVNAVLEGKLKPHLKSLPIPTEEYQAGDVRMVVAKNFDEIVNDPTKDVLINFFAPWSGHCKVLAPMYDALALMLKDEPDIVIARMNAIDNDIPEPYEVPGVPSIFFAPKNGKLTPIRYERMRNTESLLEFLAQEATSPLQGWDRDGLPRKTEL